MSHNSARSKLRRDRPTTRVQTPATLPNDPRSARRLTVARRGQRASDRDAARRRYPSDLTEQQWHAIEPLLRDPARRITCPTAPLRDVADAVSYRWRSGCSWRMLPHDFPPWSTVYTHFRQWRRRGVLTAIRSALLRNRCVGG